MNFAELPDDSSNHPEIDENPALMLPALEATKIELRDAIFSKVSEIEGNASWKFRPLFTDDKNRTVIVTRYTEGFTERTQNKIAQIAIKEFASSENAEYVRTAVTIVNSPDGLQLERSTSLNGALTIKSKHRTEDGRTIIEGSIDPNVIKARQETSELENALGMSFVSEHEARSMLNAVLSASVEPKSN